eukprot:3393196-Amphidinium_carterae.1
MISRSCVIAPIQRHPVMIKQMSHTTIWSMSSASSRKRHNKLLPQTRQNVQDTHIHLVCHGRPIRAQRVGDS